MGSVFFFFSILLFSSYNVVKSCTLQFDLPVLNSCLELLSYKGIICYLLLPLIKNYTKSLRVIQDNILLLKNFISSNDQQSKPKLNFCLPPI